MQINIKEFIEQSGLEEPFYPGKRVIKLCPQPGEYKSHCVVYDWRNPSLIRIEIKAGLSGRDMPANDLVRYPVSFQAPSFIEIDVHTGEMRSFEGSADDEEDEDSGSKGKSGSGGKRPAHKPEKKKSGLSLASFATAVVGLLPEQGIVSQIVIMGKQIAENAFASVIHKFETQIEHAKISTSDLMAAAGKLVTKFTPPAFLKPKGDESKIYKYNREKNEVMFSGMMPS